MSGEKTDPGRIHLRSLVVQSRSSKSSAKDFSLGNLMPHVQKKGSEDVEVERHNVSQWQNQHHHVHQMTWKTERRDPLCFQEVDLRPTSVIRSAVLY